MRRFTLLLPILTVALLAAITAVASPDVASLTRTDAIRGAPAGLPFVGRVAGVLLGFDTDADVIAARCTNTPTGKTAWAVTSFQGWGPVTHLGQSTVYAEHCSYATMDGPDGTYGQGELTVEAANGDILLATYDDGMSEPISDSVVGFMDHVTFIDGGTGRFTYASGGGVEMGTVDLDQGTFTIQLTGVIVYSRR